MLTRVLSTAGACAVLALAAGCGSGGGGGGSGGGGSASGSGGGGGGGGVYAPPADTGTSTASARAGGGASITVKMQNIQFAPKTVEARVGQTVRWVNEDTAAHNVTATSGATFRSDTFQQGGSYTQKLAAAGTIKYVCTIHPGMTGTIVVKR